MISQKEDVIQVFDTIAANASWEKLYSERPNRFLYGTDWPLAPMTAYREFVKDAVPPEHHAQVFEENARVLFRLG